MALRAKKLFGNETFEVLADKGYYQAKDLKKCTENGITVYITKQTYANGTKDPAFYSDQFKYDPTKNVLSLSSWKGTPLLPGQEERCKDNRL